jgi:hypothetical protein
MFRRSSEDVGTFECLDSGRREGITIKQSRHYISPNLHSNAKTYEATYFLNIQSIFQAFEPATYQGPCVRDEAAHSRAHVRVHLHNLLHTVFQKFKYKTGLDDAMRGKPRARRFE